MVAIGAVSSNAGHLTFFDKGVVFLLFSGLKPMKVGFELFKIVNTKDAGADTRFGKAISDALFGGIGNTKG
jgi:hypothetical protein